MDAMYRKVMDRNNQCYGSDLGPLYLLHPQHEGWHLPVVVAVPLLLV